jgi:sigma-B regulation protein RsbU (phosphoserine phosphatase)
MAANEAEIEPRDLDDVRPGGLGVHFMREIMDEISYLPQEGDYGNILRMVKRATEN